MKKLLAGKTIIGSAVFRINETERANYKVAYGNILYPIEKDKPASMNNEKYRALLEGFLTGKDVEFVGIGIEDGGTEYERPTEEEIEQAHITALNMFQKAKSNVEKQSEPDVVEEKEEAKDESQRNKDLIDENNELRLIAEENAKRFKEQEKRIAELERRNESISKKLTRTIKEANQEDATVQEQKLLKKTAICLILSCSLTIFWIFMYLMK